MQRCRRRSIQLVSLASGVVCLFVAAACGGTTEAQDAPAAEPERGVSIQQLYDAAREAGEDQVVVYGVEDDTCYDQFSQQFPGIEVESQYVVGELQSRIRQEFVSGQHVADVLRTGSTSLLALAQDEIMEPFTPATSEGLPSELFGPNNTFVQTTRRAAGLAYNHDRMSDADAPRSWEDLTDPRFRGQIVMPDPTGPGAGLSALQELLQSGGTTDNAWLDRLAANEPAFIRGVQPATESLKNGEYPVMFGGLDQVTGPGLEEGAPVTFVFPVDGATPVTAHNTGIVQGAPHPNAARLLETWILSEEGQTCLVERGNEYPVRDDVPSPEGFPPLAELSDVTPARTMDFDELERQQSYLAQFRDVFAR